MKFDLSRDFLDTLSVRRPAPPKGQGGLKMNANMRFLPSSPDGTMHTAIVVFTLQIDSEEQFYAQGAWRFLFTTDAKYDPSREPENDFLRGIMVQGVSKIMAVMNPLFMHANLPVVPFDPNRLRVQAKHANPNLDTPVVSATATPATAPEPEPPADAGPAATP